MLLLVPLRAGAGPFNWDGGSDISGWQGPAESAYFAEGTTRNGFEEYLLIRNPNDVDAEVTITYLFTAPAEPKVRSLFLSGGAGASICVNDVVGHGRDVSVVVAAEPGVIAERQMYFNYMGVWPGGHVTRGVAAPSDVWYFAEGTTRGGFKEWLCLQNPHPTEVGVNVTFMLGSGKNVTRGYVLGPVSRRTIAVDGVVGLERDVSTLVKAAQPIVAERPMYFDYRGAYRGGHTVSGSTRLSSEWYFAEGTTRDGFDEWLCIQNPGPETVARVEYLFPDRPSLVRHYGLRARARTTVPVNQEAGPDRDVSIKVECSRQILCERSMYFDYHGAIEGGHVVMGATNGSRTWYLPAAAVGEGFESWLCLANPGEEGTAVTVEVLGNGGGLRKGDLYIESCRRLTMDLSLESQGLYDPWVRVSASGEIVVERPSYFSYEPKVEPEPFTLANWNGVELKCPIRYSDLLGNIFHEAAVTGSGGKANNPQVMQPLGVCLQDDNPSRRSPGISLGVVGEAAYFIEETRGRGTYSTTACDVQSKTGALIYSLVDGTVLATESYLLYGKYPDLRVRILIDGQPGYHVAVLHMDSIMVSRGQRVEAGRTAIGTVRDLVPYFHSGPNPYTREEGNHAHIQINYRPDVHL